MDNTIEVCSGCGKMPRAIDNLTGSFACSRCGNKTIIPVTASDYEKVVTELDQRFHQNLQAKKIEEASKIPFEMPKRPRPKSNSKTKKITKKAVKPKKKRK